MLLLRYCGIFRLVLSERSRSDARPRRFVQNGSGSVETAAGFEELYPQVKAIHVVRLRRALWLLCGHRNGCDEEVGGELIHHYHKMREKEREVFLPFFALHLFVIGVVTAESRWEHIFFSPFMSSVVSPPLSPPSILILILLSLAPPSFPLSIS